MIDVAILTCSHHNSGSCSAQSGCFEIISISFDTDRDTWRRGIKTLKMPWVNLFADGWDNPAVKAYAVEAIPTLFLINQNGQIAADDIGHWELTGKIQDLLAAKAIPQNRENRSPEPASLPELRIFGADDCAYTQAVRDRLSEQGILFRYLNIEESDSIQNEMWTCIEHADIGTEITLPVAVYGNRVIIDGLNHYDEIVQLLAPKGPPQALVPHSDSPLPDVESIDFPDFPDTALSPDQAREFCRTLLEKYSPESFQMLQNYDALPTQFSINGYHLTLSPQTDLLDWANGYLPQELAASINTMVHETSHGYASLAAMAQLADSARAFDGSQFTCFLAGNNRSFLVKHDKTFPARKMDPTFPERLKEFRYKTYVCPSEDLQSTQVEGIFGLTGEFSAYYLGTKAAFDLYPYFEQKAAAEPARWLDYLQTVNSTLSAHDEFKLFLLYYLAVAQEDYPDYYRDFIRNKSLCQAIIQIDSDFNALNHAWRERLETIQSALTSQHIDCSQSGDYFFIGNHGVGIPFTEMAKIEKELSRPLYQQIWQDLSH